MIIRPSNADIARIIHQIEIHTRRLFRGTLVGDTRTAIKGTGFAFDQLREYQQGDDLRFIDWKASARSQSLLVKQYYEERSKTILLAIDISASSFWGTGESFKYYHAAYVASVIALIASYCNDQIGILFFADDVIQYIPPRNNRTHAYRLMETIFTMQSRHKKTNIASVLKKLMQLKRTDTIVFLFSDFIDDHFATYLPVVNKYYDIVAMRCLDMREHMIPSLGLITVEDVETGTCFEVDLRTARSTMAQQLFKQRIEKQNAEFKRCGIDVFDVHYIYKNLGMLIHFLQKRSTIQ